MFWSQVRKNTSQKQNSSRKNRVHFLQIMRAHNVDDFLGTMSHEIATTVSDIFYHYNREEFVFTKHKKKWKNQIF